MSFFISYRILLNTLVRNHQVVLHRHLSATHLTSVDSHDHRHILGRLNEPRKIAANTGQVKHLAEAPSWVNSTATWLDNSPMLEPPEYANIITSLLPVQHASAIVFPFFLSHDLTSSLLVKNHGGWYRLEGLTVSFEGPAQLQ